MAACPQTESRTETISYTEFLTDPTYDSASRRVDLVRVHRQCDEELMGARHPAEVLAGLRSAAL